MAKSLADKSAAETIYVLNGPNLNLLGTREPETYGHATLADVEKLCADTAAQFGLKADCRQSNREGELIDFIHEAHAKKAAGIVINAGGYSHTSIALHDALVGGENSDRRSAHQQHLRPREFPSSFLHRPRRLRDAVRLRHRRLPARDLRPCRQDRRQGRRPERSPPAIHYTEVSDQDHGAPA